MNDAIAWLAGWYNWPFLFPLAVGLFFILFDVLLGGVSDLIGLDADADVDVDGDLDLDASGPDGVANHVGALVLSLTWLGMGKLPISILLEILFVSFGLTGLMVTAVAADVLGSSALAFPFALAASFFCAPLATKIVGGWVAMVIPADSTSSRSPEDFLGEVGVAESPITDRVGLVRIPATDDYPQATLSGQLAPGAQEVPRGTEVLLIGHDPDRNIYVVTPNPTAEA